MSRDSERADQRACVAINNPRSSRSLSRRVFQLNDESNDFIRHYGFISVAITHNAHVTSRDTPDLSDVVNLHNCHLDHAVSFMTMMMMTATTREKMCPRWPRSLCEVWRFMDTLIVHGVMWPPRQRHVLQQRYLHNTIRRTYVKKHFVF